VNRANREIESADPDIPLLYVLRSDPGLTGTLVYDRDGVTTVDWVSYPILTFPEALGNAVFDATGLRLRTVPFRPDRVQAALAGVRL